MKVEGDLKRRRKGKCLEGGRLAVIFKGSGWWAHTAFLTARGCTVGVKEQ
jgi:hypothetical protein